MQRRAYYYHIRAEEELMKAVEEVEDVIETKTGGFKMMKTSSGKMERKTNELCVKIWRLKQKIKRCGFFILYAS